MSQSIEINKHRCIILLVTFSTEMFKELWEVINPSRKVKDQGSVVRAEFEGLFGVVNLWIDWFICLR